MTHKTYNLIESDQNGDQLEVKSYEIKPFFSHGTSFVELRKKATSFDMSNIVLGRIFATVDEVNAELPEGYEVWFTDSDNLTITLYMRK